MKQTEIVYKRISELHPYENNPRLNDKAVEPVANSIKEFGFKVPIVAKSDGEIINGHTRYKAAKRLGLDEVPVIVADDLTDEQVRAFRLADNKVGEEADWDDVLLQMELEKIDILDMTQFCFDLIDVTKDIEQQQEEKPEVEFSEILNEENNFIVLKFNNIVDWQQAVSLFNIESKKDNHPSKNMQRSGIGRVLDGPKAIQMLLGVKM